MRFTDPLWLLLLIPWMGWLVYSWGQVSGMAKGRKIAAFALRTVMGVCLIVALAGPQAVQREDGLATVFVLDRSDSVSEADRRRALEFVDQALRQTPEGALGGIVAFGKQPVVESLPGGRRGVNRVTSSTEGSASNLASAIRLASASFPAGRARRIVVLSDGNETDGDSLGAAEVAASEGIVIDTVLLGTEAKRAEALITEVQAPSLRDAEAPFDLRVVVESSVDQTGILTIDRDGVVVSRQSVNLPAGRSAVVVPQRLEKPGFYRYRASLQVPSDGDNRNNIGASFVRVKGPSRILLVQGDPARRELANALLAQGLRVDVVGPGGMPNRTEALQPYDALILNDVGAELVNERAMSLVKSAVRDTGLGFAMVGGENSFLPGGWFGTPVADVLPVDLNVRQRKSFPSTSVLIVVDTSGSMGMVEDGFPKLELAKRAGIRTIELLSPNDRVGLAGSTDQIELVLPMQSAKDKASLAEQVGRLAVGGGGIYAQPSIEFADKVLTAENSRVRHLIFLGDGADVDTYGNTLSIIENMRKRKITTTAVAIGDGKDVPFMKAMAAAGGGRFFLADRAAKLPAIFTQDVSMVARSAIEEGAFLPRIAAGEEILGGIESTPPLLAYCISEARPLARVGMKTHKNDPLLAVWNYGLGSSLAFTSDAQNRWAGQWVTWDGFSRFWAQAARSITRRTSNERFEVTVTPRGGQAEVKVEARAADGSPLTLPELKARVGSPNGEGQELVLTPVAPGEYLATVPAAEIGSYMLGVVTPGGSAVETSGFSVAYPPEYRQYAPNRGVLQSLTQTTGGQELKSPNEAWRRLDRPQTTVKDLWVGFLLAAMLLLPLDVAVRRVILPWAEFWALFRRKARREDEATAAKPLDRLAKVKARSTPSEPEASPAARPTVPITPAPPAKKSAPDTSSPAPGTLANRLLQAKRDRETAEREDPKK